MYKIPPPMAPPAEDDDIPTATATLVVPQTPAVDEEQIAKLQQQGYTKGLAESLAKNVSAFPVRIWVVDNSGSMNLNDGHRLVPTLKQSDVRLVESTRWAEIQDTIDYHAQMAALLKAPTTFRLLNNPGRHAGPQQFSIADKGDDMIPHDLDVARQTMRNASPAGVTPLTQHIREIRENVLAMAPGLDGGRVAIILATDGLPTDHRGCGGKYPKDEFVEALRGLEGLPVWIVVRLCTDEDDVLDFYSDLDRDLELSIDVLDDFVGEAHEVYKLNRWLNYALPLHRCREMGFHNRLMDLLDERSFTKAEVQDFCRLLLGDGALDGAPDASVDFEGFVKILEKALEREDQQWNPIRKRMQPWIDTRALLQQYGASSCCVM